MKRIVFPVLLFILVFAVIVHAQDEDKLKTMTVVENDTNSFQPEEDTASVDSFDMETYQFEIDTMDAVSQETDIYQSEGDTVFLINSGIDMQYVWNEYAYLPAIEKALMNTNSLFNILKKYFKNSQIAAAVRPEILDYILMDNKNNLYHTIFNSAVNDMIEGHKEFILSNFVTLPEEYSWDDFPEYKELAVKTGYGIGVSTSIISSINRQNIIDILVWFNIVWLGDEYISDRFIIKLKNKGKYFTEKELSALLEFKNEKLEHAKNIYKDLPKNWQKVVLPYNSISIPLLLQADISKLYRQAGYIFPRKEFQSRYDAVQNCARANYIFKKYFSQEPDGILITAGSISKNALDAFKIAGFNFIINNTPSYKDMAAALEHGENKIYVISSNIRIEQYRGSFQDVNRIIQDARAQSDLLKGKGVVPVWVLQDEWRGIEWEDKERILSFLFEEVRKGIKLKSIQGLKSEYMLDGKDYSAMVLGLRKIKEMDVSNVPYVFDIDVESAYIGEEWQNDYWNTLAALWDRMDEYKNSGSADYETVRILEKAIGRLESVEWFKNVFRNDMRADMHVIREAAFNSSIQTIRGLLTKENLSRIRKKSEGAQKPIQQEFFEANEDMNITYASSNIGFDIIESSGDDYGPGTYMYPQNNSMIKGVLDLRRFSMRKRENEVEFNIMLSNLENPLNAPNGFSMPVVDIYIDLNGRSALGSARLLPGRGAFTVPENAWEYCVSVNGWNSALYKVDMNNKIVRILDGLKVRANKEAGVISVLVPKDALRGDPYLWRYIVLTCGYDPDNEADNILYVQKEADVHYFGGKKGEVSSNIIDVILPKGMTQKEVLDKDGRNVAEIPAVAVN
ncbi:MAG: glucodextranase DOMON-like domain-containing protein [Elusimicrobiota bacterium]